MQLVVFSGLPGTGKTTLAEHAARLFQAPVYSADRIEAALWRSGIHRDAGSHGAMYELLGVLAEGQLRLEQSAILDAVVGHHDTRSAWQSLTRDHGASYRGVECVCSDLQLHRQRLAGRDRAIPGWYELTWEDVERARANYQPWIQERLTLDAALPLETNLRALEAYLR